LELFLFNMLWGTVGGPFPRVSYGLKLDNACWNLHRSMKKPVSDRQKSLLAMLRAGRGRPLCSVQFGVQLLCVEVFPDLLFDLEAGVANDCFVSRKHMSAMIVVACF
jgi:hypothetical protein